MFLGGEWGGGVKFIFNLILTKNCPVPYNLIKSLAYQEKLSSAFINKNTNLSTILLSFIMDVSVLRLMGLEHYETLH